MLVSLFRFAARGKRFAIVNTIILSNLALLNKHTYWLGGSGCGPVDFAAKVMHEFVALQEGPRSIALHADSNSFFFFFFRLAMNEFRMSLFLQASLGSLREPGICGTGTVCTLWGHE